MPIRPERKHLYPANWKTEIVPMLKQRSGDACEICGVKNGKMIQRGTHDSNPHWWKYEEASRLIFNVKGDAALAEGCEITWRRPIRIVLTAAHLNHDETDNRPENLALLCQLHHNRHDAAHRAATRKARATNHQPAPKPSPAFRAGEGGAHAPDEGQPAQKDQA